MNPNQTSSSIYNHQSTNGRSAQSNQPRPFNRCVTWSAKLALGTSAFLSGALYLAAYLTIPLFKELKARHMARAEFFGLATCVLILVNLLVRYYNPRANVSVSQHRQSQGRSLDISRDRGEQSDEEINENESKGSQSFFDLNFNDDPSSFNNQREKEEEVQRDIGNNSLGNLRKRKREEDPQEKSSLSPSPNQKTKGCKFDEPLAQEEQQANSKQPKNTTNDKAYARRVDAEINGENATDNIFNISSESQDQEKRDSLTAQALQDLKTEHYSKAEEKPFTNFSGYVSGKHLGNGENKHSTSSKSRYVGFESSDSEEETWENPLINPFIGKFRVPNLGAPAPASASLENSKSKDENEEVIYFDDSNKSPSPRPKNPTIPTLTFTPAEFVANQIPSSHPAVPLGWSQLDLPPVNQDPEGFNPLTQSQIGAIHVSQLSGPNSFEHHPLERSQLNFSSVNAQHTTAANANEKRKIVHTTILQSLNNENAAEPNGGNNIPPPPPPMPADWKAPKPPQTKTNTEQGGNAAPKRSNAAIPKPKLGFLEDIEKGGHQLKSTKGGDHPGQKPKDPEILAEALKKQKEMNKGERLANATSLELTNEDRKKQNKENLKSTELGSAIFSRRKVLGLDDSFIGNETEESPATTPTKPSTVTQEGNAKLSEKERRWKAKADQERKELAEKQKLEEEKKAQKKKQDEENQKKWNAQAKTNGTKPVTSTGDLSTVLDAINQGNFKLKPVLKGNAPAAASSDPNSNSSKPANSKLSLLDEIEKGKKLKSVNPPKEKTVIERVGNEPFAGLKTTVGSKLTHVYTKLEEKFGKDYEEPSTYLTASWLSKSEINAQKKEEEEKKKAEQDKINQN